MFKNPKKRFSNTHSIWLTLTDAFEVMTQESRPSIVPVTGARSPDVLSSEENAGFGSYFLPMDTDSDEDLLEKKPVTPEQQRKRRHFDFISTSAAPISDNAKTRSGSSSASSTSPRDIMSPASAPERSDFLPENPPSSPRRRSFS